MGLQEMLLQMGAVPQGQTPMVNINGEVGNASTDRLSNLLRSIQQDNFKKEQEEQKRMEKLKNQASLFTTLREAGYSPEAAYKSIMNNQGNLPDEIPATEDSKKSLETEKLKADISKTKAQEDYINVQKDRISNITEKSDLKLRTSQQKNLFDMADKLAGDLRQQQSYKDYVEIRRATSVIGEAYKNSMTSKNKIASDQALIIGFNKLLDPGSVVRESEFARTPQGQALISNFAGRLAKLSEGGTGLTSESRKEILDMANLISEKATNYALEDAKTLKERANFFGVPENMVFGEDMLNGGATNNNQEFKEGQTATNPQTGQKIIFSNGQWVPIQ